ncbi:MAG: hypothetical protein WC681_04185 [Sterolibacterium sp.]
MFAALSFLDFLTVCFMRCGAISCMFWLCYMMLAIRAVGQTTANTSFERDAQRRAAPQLHVEAVGKLNFEKCNVCEEKTASQNALHSTIFGRGMLN